MKISLEDLKENIKKLQNCDFQQNIFEILVNSLFQEKDLTILCTIGAPSDYNYRERWLCQVIKKLRNNYEYITYNVLSDADDKAYDSRKDAFNAGIEYVLKMIDE